MPGEVLGLVGLSLVVVSGLCLVLFVGLAAGMWCLEWLEDRHARHTVLDRLGEDAEVAQLEAIWEMS